MADVASPCMTAVWSRLGDSRRAGGSMAASADRAMAAVPPVRRPAYLSGCAALLRHPAQAVVCACRAGRPRVSRQRCGPARLHRPAREDGLYPLLCRRRRNRFRFRLLPPCARQHPAAVGPGGDRSGDYVQVGRHRRRTAALRGARDILVVLCLYGHTLAQPTSALRHRGADFFRLPVGRM